MARVNNKTKPAPAAAIIRETTPVRSLPLPKKINEDPDEVVIERNVSSPTQPKNKNPNTNGSTANSPAKMNNNTDSRIPKKNIPKVTPSKTDTGAKEIISKQNFADDKEPLTKSRNTAGNNNTQKQLFDNSSSKITVITNNKVNNPNSNTSPVAEKSKFGIVPIKKPNKFGNSSRPVNSTYATNLKCAFIDGNNERTVVFWFEQMGRYSYWTQNKLKEDIIEGTREYVAVDVPFNNPQNDPTILYLHLENQFIPGFGSTTFGLRLFHYTTNLPGQNEEALQETAYCIAENLNKRGNAYQVLVKPDFLEYGYTSCKWSNLLSEPKTLQLLKYEAEDNFNDENTMNPYFWDDKKAIIEKYFWTNKLSAELSAKFNSPLDTISPEERTAEVVKSVMYRRGQAKTMDRNQTKHVEKRDPQKETCYGCKPDNSQYEEEEYNQPKKKSNNLKEAFEMETEGNEELDDQEIDNNDETTEKETAVEDCEEEDEVKPPAKKFKKKHRVIQDESDNNE